MKKEINIKNMKSIQSYRTVNDNKWVATLIFDCTLGNATKDKIKELMKSKNVKIVYEVEDEILDEQEKKYLGNLIRPFRNKVLSIMKTEYYCAGEEKEFISILMCNDGDVDLPIFKKGTMYKGMELNKQYTLKELGL